MSGTGKELKAALLEALRGLEVSGQTLDLISAEMIEDLDVSDGGAVRLTLLHVTETTAAEREALEDVIYEALEALEGVSDVTITPKTPAPASSCSASGQANAPEVEGPQSLPGVGQVIAIASGKGGVGKSTVAVNVALALAKLGFKVGVLDLDVYGPSMQTLLRVRDVEPRVQDGKLLPIRASFLKVMSLGFMVEEDAPVIWRGPMVHGLIRQFLRDVDWSGTDYLIVDLPPGTGDAQLSFAQSVPVDGAVIVTTPSDLALADAARGLQMFRTLDVEVLGFVENMSHYIWPGTARARELIQELRESGAAEKPLEAFEKLLDEYGRLQVFGEAGSAREAEKLGVALLSEIPLDGELRARGDEGKPLLLDEPTTPSALAFVALAKKLVELKPLEEGTTGQGVFTLQKN